MLPDIALISCASSTLSRNCIPSGKKGMIGKPFTDPLFLVPKAKRRFAGHSSYEFLLETIPQSFASRRNARGFRLIAMQEDGNVSIMTK